VPGLERVPTPVRVRVQVQVQERVQVLRPAVLPRSGQGPQGLAL